MKYQKYIKTIKTWLDELGIDYKFQDQENNQNNYTPDFILNDRIYIYLNIMQDLPRYNKKYTFNQVCKLRKQGIRAIQIYEPYLLDPVRVPIIKNIIEHACNKSKHKIFARKLDVEIHPAKLLTPFFTTNNIQGYRTARTAFCLTDKSIRGDINKRTIMCYTVGHAFFGKGIYDAEIARGACKLGYSVTGGASKLWKHIIKYYENKTLYDEPGSVDSIVYYVDLNHYDGQSIHFLDNCELVNEDASFWNYWLENKQLRNREPKRHSYIMQQTRDGKIIPIYNAGTQVNVWSRYLDFSDAEELQ